MSSEAAAHYLQTQSEEPLWPFEVVWPLVEVVVAFFVDYFLKLVPDSSCLGHQACSNSNVRFAFLTLALIQQQTNLVWSKSAHYLYDYPIDGASNRNWLCDHDKSSSEEAVAAAAAGGCSICQPRFGRPELPVAVEAPHII